MLALHETIYITMNYQLSIFQKKSLITIRKIKYKYIYVHTASSLNGCFCVYTLLTLSQVAEGTVFRKHMVAETDFVDRWWDIYLGR